MVRPIKDTPAEHPGLEFSSYSKIISDMLINTDPTSFTVGIFGGYGSGKTTLMKSIRKNIDDNFNDKEITTIWFDAWRFDHEQNLLVPLILCLRDQLSKKLKNSPDIRKITATLWNASIAIFRSLNVNFGIFGVAGNDIIDAFDKNDNNFNEFSDYVSIYFEIVKALQSLTIPDGQEIRKRKFVVFIDDLDRCKPSKAFFLLESIKAIFDIQGYMFVLGLDPRVIDYYLSSKYGEKFCISGQEYLEKMIQIPFYIPTLDNKMYIEDLIEYCEGINISLPENVKTSHEYLPSNIRSIKRLANRYLMLAKLGVKIESDLLLSLLIFQAKWPQHYKYLSIYKDVYFNYLYPADTKDYKIEVENDTVANLVQDLLQDKVFVKFYKEVFRPSLKNKDAIEIIKKTLPFLGI